MKLKLKPSSLIKIQIFMLVAFIAFFTSYFSDLKKQMRLSKKEITGYRKFLENYKREIEVPKETVLISQSSLPEKLQNIPFAESEGVVLRTKKINIRNVFAPHNPSLIKYGKGYLMFFCYNTSNKTSISSHIGSVELDKDFEQTSKEFVKIDTFNENSEDPRVFQVGKETYLAYTKNDTNTHHGPASITMNIAGINLENCKVNFTTELDLNFRLVEQNWVPFEYINSQGKPEICFQYNFNPHKILELPNPKVNHLLHPVFSRYDISCATNWDRHGAGWGNIQGGTPALKIDNDYLGFFHSSFSDQEGVTWYAMGAYTFEASPPFRIKALSPYPILFSGIYNSVNLSFNETKRQVIFPAGFVIETEGDKELIHLSCGENDSTIKIITIDKKRLLENLKKI